MSTPEDQQRIDMATNEIARLQKIADDETKTPEERAAAEHEKFRWGHRLAAYREEAGLAPAKKHRYSVSSATTEFGLIMADSEQEACDLCAKADGYRDEADMIERLGAPSDMTAWKVE